MITGIICRDNTHDLFDECRAQLSVRCAGLSATAAVGPMSWVS